MIYLFDKDENLIKVVRKTAVKTALQTYSLTTEKYVSDRLTVEMKALSDDELERVEYMAIQAVDDTHNFHFFYVAQKHSEGKLTELIGVQSGIEELRKTPIYDKRPKNAFAREVIADLLAGTNWSARFVGETLPKSTNFYYTSVFDALKKVCQVWDLEMQFFVQMNGNQIGARVIDFKKRIGTAVGKRVVYGHNALQILQEVERTNIYTALIGRGKGEQVSALETNETTNGGSRQQQADGYGRKVTFEEVVWRRSDGKPVDKPAGQKYVELPEMTARYGIKQADGSMKPKIGFVEFSEEEDKEVVLQKTYEALVDASRPQVTFKTSAVYLKGMAIGDTVRVVRHDKRLDYDTRIFELTINRLNNQSSDIKLGDRITEGQASRTQAIADRAVDNFIQNEFSNFVQNLPDFLPSADGFNTNWYGSEDPTVQHKGKVIINDIWYKPDPEHEGHKIMLRWTGEVWEELVRTSDNDRIKRLVDDVQAQADQLVQQAQEADQKAANALNQAGASSNLAETARQLAAEAKGRAEEFNQQALARAQQLSNELAQTSQQLRVVEQDVSGTKTALKNIWVGDRNLLADTEKMSDQNPKRNGNGSLATMFGRAIKRAEVPAGSSAIAEGYQKPLSVSLYGDKELIVSFYAKALVRGQVIRCQLLDNRNIVKVAETSTGHTNEASDGLVELPVTDGWLRYWIRYTFKQPCYDKPIVVLGSIGGTPSGSDRWAEVNSPAVYYGHHNKEWSPSDVDIRTDFANYQQTVTQNLAELGGQLRTTTGDLTELKTSFDQTKDRISLLASKQDLDGLTGRVASAESSLVIQANQIAQRLTRAEVDNLVTGKGYVTGTTFDNYKAETAQSIEHRLTETRAMIPREIGGTNLLSGSKTMADFGLANIDWMLEQETYRGLVVWSRDREWMGIHKRVMVTAGETYTFSAYVKRRTRGNAYIFIHEWGDEPGFGQVDVSAKEFYNIGSDWQRISHIFTVTKTGTIIPRVEIAERDKLYTAGYKLELGTVATDWSEAPEDNVSTVDFNQVKETAQLYERVLGRTEGDVATNIARQAITSQLFQTEVASYAGASDNLVVDSSYFRENYIEYAGLTFKEQCSIWVAPKKATQAGYIRIQRPVAVAQRWPGVVLPLYRKRFKAGETYTLSYDKYIYPGTTGTVAFQIKTSSSEGTIFARAVNTTDVVGRWIRVNEILTIENDAELNYPTSRSDGLYIWMDGTGDVIFRNIMLTAGEKVLPYAPNPNDDERIQTGTDRQALTATTTRVTQLADSWAVKVLNSGGDILSQLNLNSGGVKIQGKLIHLNGQTLIDNGVIKSAMIESVTADKMTTGTLNAANVNIINLNANKLVGLDANFIKAKIETALVEWLRGKVISAQNDAMRINLNRANITFNSNATIDFNSGENALKRVRGHTTGFIQFSDDPQGGVYTNIGVSSHGIGLRYDQDFGKFSGVRIQRSTDNDDSIKIYGDTIELRHSVGASAFKFYPTTMRQDINMNYLVNAVKSLALCFAHLRANHWDWALPNVRAAISSEMDNYQRLIEPFERI